MIVSILGERSYNIIIYRSCGPPILGGVTWCSVKNDPFTVNTLHPFADIDRSHNNALDVRHHISIGMCRHGACHIDYNIKLYFREFANRLLAFYGYPSNKPDTSYFKKASIGRAPSYRKYIISILL